ncbi:bifunctional folylpolyglutamate synthase/dihydrofolate synthase [Kineobactrum salinum]|uniref:Dihydrofolate synthase/folylpolyglutamate synthase n=1 Tax=Kineobactrum salinum TaxID=2708301 RepID=A0A6C0U587_9GAMM|nr:folylpolyglutamate synthase/dihydrofolate synthase family protein [Kineobactrum salinum]QIB67281.1 bifunctional folylpolyglutamate synthase/dihydrofolate synthase [Kineobactrum salinum]
MTEQSLAAWLARLESLHPREIELGLDRVSEVARRLELLPVQVPVITVAGTNGKGSTVAVLEAVTAEMGHRAGVYTSPHLLRFNERIRIAGVEATDLEIVSALQEIDAARTDISLTYFEFATLAALLIFRQQAVSIMVLEVGLGGRLDAVNIVDASAAVITSIALDHQQWLGHSVDAIAREKAGILRPGRPAVIAERVPPAALVEAVTASGADALWLGREFDCQLLEDGCELRLALPGGGSRRLLLSNNPALLPENICAALQVLALLQLDCGEQTLQRVLPALQPPGRRQRLWIAEVEYVLDVAHNPAAAYKLRELLNSSPCKGKEICVFSAMADKDIAGMIEAVSGQFDGWCLADQPQNARAAKGSDMAAMLRQRDQQIISVSADLSEALDRARSLLTAGDRLVVFGSFHTVAAALSSLEQDRGRADR